MITPFDRPTTFLFLGVLAFLTVATLASFIIRRRSQKKDGANNLVSRVGSWWGMVAIFGVALLVARWGTFVLFVLIAMQGLRELTRLPSMTKLGWARFVASAALVALPGMVLLIVGLPRGREMLIWLVIVTEMSDVLQYCWGKLFGRTKIVPRVSPKKTWEGLIGGVLSATALGVVLRWLTPFTLVQSIYISLTISLAGFVGGLLMSAIKRDAGVKDFGTLIPGHGGVMDRIDSLTIAAPIFYFVAVRFSH